MRYQWQRARVGYRLHDTSGGGCRAIVIPIAPRAANGFARWQIDAIGYASGAIVRAHTLKEAKRMAEAKAD